MLDLYNEISSYGPINIEGIEETKEEDTKAYELYNKALIDIKTGNEDIASIKLKKAIALKEDFYLAKLILGVYQADKGNYKGAIRYFEDVVNNDSDYGVSALKYLRELNVTIEKKENEENEDKSYVIKYPKEKKEKSRIKDIIIGLVIGIIIMIPILVWLQGRDENSSANNQNTNNTNNIIDVDEYISQINELSSKNESLKTENESLKKQIEEIQNKDDDKSIQTVKENYINLLIDFIEIERLSYEDKYIEAADEMKIFTDEYEDMPIELETYVNDLYSKTMDEAALYCEEHGVALYEQGNYESSIELLLKTENYRPTYENMYRIIYYIGKNQMELEEYSKAIENFEEVTRIAPNQEWLNYANTRINEINEILQNESESEE